MEFRSSNYGFVSPKDIQSNCASSHGVLIAGGSTGGSIAPVGDDANISISLKGKGTGPVTIGDSSQAVTIAGGLNFKGFFNSTFTVEFAAVSSGQVTQVSISTAFGSFAIGDLVNVYAVVTPAEAVMTGWRMATDASTRLTLLVSNPGSTATSTGRVTGNIVWADLT